MNIKPNDPQKASGAGAPVSSRVHGARADRAVTASPVASTPSGTVELSPRAQAMLKMRSQLDAAPGPGRQDRVAALRALVASGRYAVDAAGIADAMLRDEAAASMLGVPVSR